MLTPPGILVLVAVFFAAAIVQGMVGLGFSLIAAAVVAVMATPREAALLVTIAATVQSVQQVYLHRTFAIILRRLLPLVAGASVGVVVGASLLVYLPVPVISLFFGAFTLWYVATQIRRREPGPASQLASPRAAAVGAVAGITSGSVGASGPVLGTFLSSAGLAPREFVFAIGFVFLAMNILRLGSLTALGQYDAPTLVLAMGLVVPALLGQRVGHVLHERSDVETFRRLVLTVLLAAGVALVVKGLAGLLATGA